MLFLSHLEKLIIDIDGECRTLERVVDSDVEFSDCHQTHQQRLQVGSSEPAPEDSTTRQFQVWTRTIGGDEDTEQAERIRTVVKHLPNRWPEVRRVTVGIAVEEAPNPEEGVFVIFLPTEMTTGTGAYINAPFYGSLDRRQIHFKDSYNKMLLESVLDLCLDVVTELISEEPEDWRARAVIDLLSSTGKVGGEGWRFMDRLHDRALERDYSLENQTLILCDNGWHIPGETRMMPDIDDNLIGTEIWREHAEFAVISTVLDERQDAIEELLTKLDGSSIPTHYEWQRTIEWVARNVQTREIDVTWDDFLNSLIVVLPDGLRSEPWGGRPDPLVDTKFLPTQDGRLISASDSAKLFFQPVRGVDSAADLVGDVPDSVKHLVAFLHQNVRIREEGPQGRYTAVQEFLSGRFVRTFEREELLRVVISALPPLPASHEGPEADLCAELFTWTIRFLVNEELETLLPLIRRLPVACHGGWFSMTDGTFGPGWSNRLGDLIWSLADELPKDAAIQLRKTALLPPDDPRWRVAVKDRAELFACAGVIDGLRLQDADEVCFWMQGDGSHEFPPTPPHDTPQVAWDDWRNVVHEQTEPSYTGWHEYTLSGIQLLPEIHYIETLSQSGRHALSCLLLASLESWPTNWELATIRKSDGRNWSKRVTSPLKYWLKTLTWLNDGNTVKPLSHRWLVPGYLLQVPGDRFRHLDPLSLDLARKLEDEPELKAALIRLGLNVYPTEDDQTGPELLEALAAAWSSKREYDGVRFDMFLGQVRYAWKKLDPDKGLPKNFLVMTAQRTFSKYRQNELADVYLPDKPDQTRSLREHGKYILEMHTADATRLAKVLLDATTIRRASTLEERFLINDTRWTGTVDEVPHLDETRYTWLPTILLTIAAHGGARTGSATETWREAANRLRRTHVLECETIAIELVDDDQVVASSEPKTQWLPGDVLAIRRDVKFSYESLAPAAQAMLDRQDLLKDLRLVLGALDGDKEPTSEQIEAAMERAEIDAQDIADIRHQWAGTTSLLVDRIRPVLELLEIPVNGFDSAATNIECLTEWLSSNVQQWPAPEILSAARRSHDIHAMGMTAWRVLGDDVAQLPAWNKALTKLGDRYVAVENSDADKQIEAHLEEAKLLLRGFARYVAIEVDNPDLFHKIEAIHQNFKGGDDWPTRWWEVPFGAIIDELCTSYAEILSVEHDLEMLEGVTTVDDLRAAFQAKGIATESDPYENADANKRKLEEVVRQVHDLHRAWVELRSSSGPIASDPELQELDTVAYLRSLTDDELLERALSIIGDADFVQACDDCVSVDDIRKRLRLDQKVIDAQREKRLQRKIEAERQRRTFEVAGRCFEVGAMSYRELFDRLSSLSDPEGPQANKDKFTPLTQVGPSGGGSGGGGRKAVKTSHLRPSAELSELVGIVGEMHAYRFLRAKFGNNVVTWDTWVSEIRLKVRSLVKGEPDNTSDSYGYDFQFSHQGKKWHVEVKATTGDDPQFDLGISEIDAATDLALRGERWRILRIRNALSDQPEFDWLPNPFEEKYKELFHRHRGGMMVSYRRKKT